MKWLDAARTCLGLLFARRAAESRMNQEFQLHIELDRTTDAHEGPRARRGVEKHKDALRDGRGLAWLGGFSLDLKIGLRKFVRYPGLTSGARHFRPRA